ncbi:peptide chain release factor N(5)-glutamine methyltransferase [Neisseria animalis]|uniref:Release factor glutamine methyltransferase n=1 Tax=Neisseria animalis TaxID=492 RepID=A0A5P3MRD8_NEIAN|nr:peptide chain release factor N(5)-glutamine methyltransferase [Neisseria animalis]QEY24163.1 peptide chain release factor N(5)-glutamine methyltransferase [Neisseria animalis]ROW32231.1 peptide chain release factor N(5)-glutamine methyltransferase [Neisseria animalis]VEE06415.1 HemK protein [Neisseria animalis]
MTLEQWLRQCPLPKAEARMLLQYAGGYTRVRLVTCGHDKLPENVGAALAALQQRRQNGEPMAYILGEREFYGRRFAVNRNVLIPRPETEHLVEAVLDKLPPNGRIWDLGTGSGAVAVTVALEREDAEVHASDISSGALAVARQNAADLGAAVTFACGSWFEAGLPQGGSSSNGQGSYDVIVSNPPYIEAEDEHLAQGDLRFEPQNALTDFADGLSCIRILAQGAPAYLKNGGWLVLEHGYNQGAAVRDILSSRGFTAVSTLPDLAGLDRITQGQWSGS